MNLINSYHWQDSVCLVQQWPRIHSVHWQRQQPTLMSKQTRTSAGRAFCDMQGHSFSSTVQLLLSASVWQLERKVWHTLFIFFSNFEPF
jgi:hypothetical protein